MDFSKCFKTMSLPVLLFKLNFCKNDKRFCLHFLYKTSFFSTTFPKFSMKVKILCPSTILHCCSLGNYILIKLQKCCCEGEFFWHITSLRCSWQTLKSVLKNLWISLRNTINGVQSRFWYASFPGYFMNFFANAISWFTCDDNLYPF